MPREEQAIQNNISNYISIEEAIDCRNANSRFFSLLNKESFLNIIISEQSTIISCKLDTQEIVVDRSLYNETHETWALGDRPYQKLSNLVWNSHVRGSELILSSSFLNSNTINAPNINNNNINNNNNSSQPPHTSLYFELTRSNELNCIGKLKTIHLQHQVIYFNLNQATKVKAPIDGHTLAVKCNGNMNRIQVQQTKLLCSCNKLLASKNAFAQSLIGDIPCELTQSHLVISNDGHPKADNPDDIIICDSIYSLEATCALDFLQAHLQFLNRSIVFEVRSVKSVGISSNNNNVSSSTTPASTSRNKATSSRQSAYSNDYYGSSNNNIDLRQQVNPTEPQAFQRLPQSSTSSSSSSSPWASNMTTGPQQHAPGDDSIASSSSSSSATMMNSVKLEPQDSSVQSSSTSLSNASATSSSNLATSSGSNEAKHQVITNDASVKKPSALYPSTILRMRIRVTNFGVCILPYMMTNYTGSYKFNW